MRHAEFAQREVAAYLENAEGSVALDDLIKEVWSLTDDGDPRWIGVAIGHLSRAGQVRHLTCDHNHNHNSGCMVEWVRS